MTTHAEIMRVALEKYLGTEEQWCTGTYAKTAEGDLCDPGAPVAASHCAEGAIRAASRDLTGDVWANLTSNVLMGVEAVLVAENPGIVQAMRDHDKLHSEKWKGDTLPIFNDGVLGKAEDGHLFHIEFVYPGVGYQGIKAAFEKYLTQCEEKGL